MRTNSNSQQNPPDSGWKQENSTASLSEAHSTIPVHDHRPPWRKFLAYVGPGALVAVGYMDPGNWATNLAGGSKFAFALLSVILISNLMAILLQTLSVRLGIATGRDLAQACRDHYSKPVSIFLWILAEIAIAATDLAELIGAAVALNLLFGLPLMWGLILTAFDVLLLLALQNRGFRWLEAFVITLMVTIFLCFGIEMLLAKPEWSAVLKGYVPSAQILTNPEMLYIAIGILGATVMPHNLYLHSSLVQTRAFKRTESGKKEAIKFATLDTVISLMLALLVNSAMLILAASVFYRSGRTNIVEITQVYELLSPMLGTAVASTLFGVALLACGQNATITGTLSGQIVMEGFLNFRIKPWIRRLITRLIAVTPAVIVTYLYGAKGVTDLLVLSQVILSLQLSFAVFPLLIFTSDRRKMGIFVSPTWLKVLGWTAGVIIAALNIYLLLVTFGVVKSGG
ncbi:Nramp family divalent metal transporter [Deinococcus cellulosilyticus]|uniref:Divalent metal cation transporter MntH n=1 Tax=Deinococcus cellulosilyticus (strain DSM 18568 / NBRC 106333 / KACC 11606 / 5516J-15) TaxID=1223518 RepID=A0A511N3W4_DEIC1|nr:Nramp family divalent metal transporter [Deinococcus cellulosilyticus]GEM47158.1 divalent metal cation transporter MntH [Deinococcus cellulosilyticus NBRC 106333 = KACC 11606]